MKHFKNLFKKISALSLSVMACLMVALVANTTVHANGDGFACKSWSAFIRDGVIKSRYIAHKDNKMLVDIETFCSATTTESKTVICEVRKNPSIDKALADKIATTMKHVITDELTEYIKNYLSENGVTISELMIDFKDVDGLKPENISFYTRFGLTV